jgi:hypothetical protein
MSLMKQLMISIGRRRTTTQFVVTAVFAQLPGQLTAQRSWSFIKLLLLLILLLLLFLVGRPAGRRNHLRVVMVVTSAAASVVDDNDVAALWSFERGTTWQGADPYPEILYLICSFEIINPQILLINYVLSVIHIFLQCSESS